MNHTEMLAKVLASENLTVQVSKAPTASFDLQNRILTIPKWDNMDAELELMLVLHEVGHALFTPQEYMDVARESKAMSGIINVVEDPRIERLMKEKFPGSRKSFATGYSKIRDMDFLEIKDRDVNSMSLIDRINIYHKAGPLSGVKFSREEAVFVNRSLTTVSFEDAVVLARDIYDYCKAKAMSLVQYIDNDDILAAITDEADAFDADIDSMGVGYGDEGDGEEGDEGDGEAYSGHGFHSYEGGSKKSEEEKMMSAETVLTLERNVSKFVEGSAAPVYINLPAPSGKDVIVGYKHILDKMRNAYGGSIVEEKDDHLQRFRSQNMKKVNHIVSLFELKKAAKVYALRSIRKTGVLDTKKVAQYKIKEDIFRRHTVVPEGKNHGMVMLLDWSASMYSGRTIHHSLNQIMQLVYFCKATGIPYRVYAFSDPVVDGHRHVSLLELFSNEMDLKDHNSMVKFVQSQRLLRYFQLRNTPFAPALIEIRPILEAFKKRYRTEKLNLITFTDGVNTSPMVDLYIGRDVIAIDKDTKRHYKIYDAPQGEARATYRSTWRQHEINALYQNIKDRFGDGITITSYFATSGGRGERLSSALAQSGVIGVENMSTAEKDRDFSTHGFLKVKGYGRDAIYIIKSSILEDDDLDLRLQTISPDMTPAKIANTIKGGRKGNKSKVMIENFVETIS